MENLLSDLIRKYDVPGPRYTSYPTVPAWKGLPEGIDSWKAALQESLLRSNEGVSIYLHIPFCRSLCAFCGCTKVITRDRELGPRLIRAIHRELSLYAAMLPRGLPLRELHLGGGTPTWLDHKELGELLHPFLSGPIFERDKKTALSIEIDPRTVAVEHIDLFKELNFSRVSIGVQDFNPEVMKIIHREQSAELVASVVKQLRSRGIHGLNFDLVYGLPKQTPQSVAESLRQVLDLKPDRVAFYSYAHVPWMRPAQKLLEPHGLPCGAEKRALYEAGREIFEAFGYKEIGMDHFALPSDELHQASLDGRLHRNFMGYTVRRSNVLLGFGPSSLSDCGDAFAQNEKNVSNYFESVERGRLPVVHGHVLNPEEQMRRRLVLDISCRLGADLKSYQLASAEIERLAALEKDGLIKISESAIKVTSLGRIFLRNICMALDPNMHDQISKPTVPLFSRSI